MAIQKNFAEHNLQAAAQTITVRVGMSAGEPVADNMDLFGATVNLAARVCSFAQASQILTSNVIRELSVGKPFVFSEVGEIELKGFTHPLLLHEVKWRAVS
jgi:adenylate cyclase